MIRSASFVLLFVGSMLHSQLKPPIAIEQVDWLVGTWLRESKKGPRFESWWRAENGELHGRGFAVNKSDTVVFEGLRIAMRSGVLHYIPNVVENKGEVFFHLVQWTDTSFVFENLSHDFPNRISYFRFGLDSMNAFTEGKEEESPKIWFRFRRVSP